MLLADLQLGAQLCRLGGAKGTRLLRLLLLLLLLNKSCKRNNLGKGGAGTGRREVSRISRGVYTQREEERHEQAT